MNVLNVAKAITAAALLALSPAAAQERSPPASDAEPAVASVARLHRIDRLPRYKRAASIGIFSSYDRTGGNDDGFEGTHSFIRKEPGGLVIAEMKGPGAITRIWTPTPSDDLIEFYFDGEATPRIREKFSDLFSGGRHPFVAPVSGIGAGGFYTYLPIPYARSMKVVVKADRFNFYQLNYETYAPGERVEPFRAGAPSLRGELDKARALFAAGGDAVIEAAAGGDPVERRAVRATLPPGGRVTLFERRAPGRVLGLKLGPAATLAGPGRDVLLDVYYEGEETPSVSLPAGDFFGYAWGEPATRSLLLGTGEGGNYAYLPMPFDRAIRIDLRSTGRAPVEVAGEVAFTDRGRRPDEGRLYAVWRREAPTVAGKPYGFVEMKGRGHLVGAILQAQGPEPGAIPEFFEGDDQTWIDGRLAIQGTGSEDFFNGGWYDVPGRWDGRVSLPLSGALAFKRHLARTGGYRFFLSDPYPFRRSIRQTIEHGPSGNKIPTDYASVTFLYADRPPPAERPADRAVRNPREVVFTPGWTTPVEAFSWKDATLAKADDRIGGEDLRHLRFRATGREVFGPHYVVFGCEMPEAGRYRVLVQAIAGPAQGRVQLFRDEVPVGEAVDLYAPARAKTAELPLGELRLAAGRNPVMFKVVGKDSRSEGLGFDAYRIVFRRVD